MIAESGLTRAELVALFGTARDRWIGEDPDGWLARHQFYPGVVARLRSRLEQDEFFILTTKQERFVRRLLATACPGFPNERIFGLDAGVSKEDLLERLISERQGADCAVRFVEDRLDTLDRVIGRPRLKTVRLYLASWGYARDEDVERARRMDGIRVWDLPDFLSRW